MYKIHRIFFGYESKQMPNALTPKRSGAAQFKKPCISSSGFPTTHAVACQQAQQQSYLTIPTQQAQQAVGLQVAEKLDDCG